MYVDPVEFSTLKGLTFAKIERCDDNVLFTTTDGHQFDLYHEQDCCEQVTLDDVDGDLQDLIGSEILLAEEVSSDLPAKDPEWEDSYTWTFYKLATRDASITMRWYGTSNGYYSESADLYPLAPSES